MSDNGQPNAEATDPPSDSAVNPQIIDAVKQSTDFVFGLNPPPSWPGKVPVPRISAGAAIAFEKAAQAGALAIQDTTDYQRNIQSISAAAQGKALALMLANPTTPNLEAMSFILILAVACPLLAAVTAGVVGAEVNKTLADFPRD
jgi:hypothetical protein